MVHTKIYVIECKTPRFWYVGSTFRELFDRIAEHENSYGSLWTRRHGFKRMVMWADVPSYALLDPRGRADGVADAPVRRAQRAWRQLCKLPTGLLRERLVAAQESTGSLQGALF